MNKKEISFWPLHTGTETGFTGLGSQSDSMWSHVSSTLHANYAHWTTGLDLTLCPGALSHSTPCSSDLGQLNARWKQSGLKKYG